MLLVALFLPPLYLLIQKKYGLAVITAILFVIGLGLCFLVFPLLICWGISALIGLFQWKTVRAEKRDERQAQRIGEKVAANMQPK